ncbi:hypothetical protein SPBR_06595 [Sporothrix brasiliensis 5110]|uniref:Zn(2)-C6 fungal-type domain-containing protein n=1 Tax=Sporothrix brasiliensis 5110 TaxID=1398154 RepID=A0A0C2ERX2_9PEZI|nr:uncharacterized protein SPBR_06595 [Sporothrix brasiliensis 5110]KIH89099.1 hypothetical protein SPBR_06595 [Sporothrix brasiliensis 5110]
MVFSGKPSTGCQMCRTRRIKCDEAKPACNQCIRTNRTCPGYKSKIDLLFRNETEASAAEKRARTTARKKAAATLRSRQAGRAAHQTPDTASFGGSVTLPAHTGSGHARSTDSDSPDDSLAKASLRFVAAHGRRGNMASYGNGFGASQNGNSADSTGSYSSGSSRYYYGSIVPALPVPPDQLAVCHFYSNFVLVPFQGTGRGYMDFLVPMMKDAESPTSLYASIGTKEAAALSGASDVASPSTPGTAAPVSSSSKEARAALSIAFRACALASMGTRVASNGFAFADKALSAYTRALAATHLALRDPALSRADNTLGAVLLLSLFESITAKHMGLFAWGSHIEGAVEIVKARNLGQRKTRSGLSLFIAVRTQMIIHCLASGKAPDMDVDWWMADAVADSAAGACQRLSIRTAALRSRAADLMATSSDRSPENVARIMALAQEAYSLDRDCVAWQANVPVEWRYHTVAWQDKLPEGGDYGRAEVFPGKIDVYRDIYIASVWNMVRATRLCLASIGVRCAAWACAPADYRTTSQYATAARMCSDIITDIIASVPFYLGWHKSQDFSSSSASPDRRHHSKDPPSATQSTDGSTEGDSDNEYTPSLGFVCGDDSSLKGLAGYFLAWPLTNINSQDYTTDNQRAWVIGRLKHISNELGVRYAGFLAELRFRVPSMLIRRDRVMSQHQHLESLHNMQAFLSATSGVSPPGVSMASTGWSRMQVVRHRHPPPPSKH